MNRPKRVILHCSATPDYPDTTKKYDLFGAADFDAMHRKRGFAKIGYHYVIRRTGVLETGRAEKERGAHCKGHNDDTLGICWVGTRWPTAPQVETLVGMYRVLLNRHHITAQNWIGHYELNPRKDCPGFSMFLFRQMLAGLSLTR